jgi:predicted nucleic acid-binding protein
MFLVLDTSVILKWYKEEYTEVAVKLKRDLMEGLNNVIASDLILYEMANVSRFTEGFNEDLIKKSFRKFY